MTVGTSYTAVGEALSAGSADIGFISGGNYVLFSDDCDVLLTALRYAINKDSENPADWNDGTIEEKIEAVVKKIYGGKGINILPAAQKQIAALNENGFAGFPVCIAKTQYSFSDDPALLGAPEDFTVTVKNVKISAGAGFIVVLTGDIMTMPGLPKHPAAERIDIDENGIISGLF